MPSEPPQNPPKNAPNRTKSTPECAPRSEKVSLLRGRKARSAHGGASHDEERPPSPWRGRQPDTVGELDRLVRQVLRRLRALTPEEAAAQQNGPTVGSGGRRRKVLPPFNPARANAIAALARLRLDLYSQYLAGEELRRLRGQLDEVLPIVRAIRHDRGV